MDTTEEFRNKQTEEQKEIPCVTEKEPVKIIYKDRIQYAGFWLRFWAYLIDLLIVGSLNRIFIFPIHTYFDLPIDNTGTFSLFVISTTSLSYLYFLVMTKVFGQTLGKMVFGLKVLHRKEGCTSSWVDLIFREIIGKFISKIVFFLGFLVIAFTKKKQGWHDLIGDTIVIVER